MNFEALEVLLQAPSKQFVEQIFSRVFHTLRDPIPDILKESTAEALEAKQEEAEDLLKSIRALISTVLYHGEKSIDVIFPEDFHANLKELIQNVLKSNFSDWREEAIKGSVSLPKYLDVNWRVDIQSSTEVVSRMSVPSVLAEVHVQKPPTKVGQVEETETIPFEMTKETLQTLLNGLGQIRDQLGAIGSHE